MLVKYKFLPTQMRKNKIGSYTEVEYYLKFKQISRFLILIGLDFNRNNNITKNTNAVHLLEMIIDN